MVDSKIEVGQQNAILTPDQVAEELVLRVDTVRDLMRRRILPAAKVGGSWRTTRRALYGYLENQMGVSGGVHGERGKDPSTGVLQVQRRGPSVGKGPKAAGQGIRWVRLRCLPAATKPACNADSSI